MSFIDFGNLETTRAFDELGAQIALSQSWLEAASGKAYCTCGNRAEVALESIDQWEEGMMRVSCSSCREKSLKDMWAEMARVMKK